MGIQDRDYWRERHWEEQGMEAPKRASASQSSSKPSRSFRIIDKVRVRPDNYVPDPITPSLTPQKSSYSVAVALALAVCGMLGFFVYKLFL